MERSVSRRRSLDRNGQTITHHIEGFNLRANRRDLSRSHDLASRAPRRRKELGLPLLLAAGCHLHTLGLDASGILRRSPGMARLAYSCGRRQSAPGADHVRSGWGAVVTGIGRPLAAWL